MMAPLKLAGHFGREDRLNLREIYQKTSPHISTFCFVTRLFVMTGLLLMIWTVSREQRRLMIWNQLNNVTLDFLIVGIWNQLNSGSWAQSHLLKYPKPLRHLSYASSLVSTLLYNWEFTFFSIYINNLYY